MAYLKSNQLSKFFNNKTISVVGNANSLLESNYGTLIDSADIVCRFNLGPKLIAPQSHGTRTDWCIYNNYLWASSANAFDITANCKWLEINYDFELELDIEIDAYTLPQESRIKFGNDRSSIGITFLHYLTTCNPKQVNIFGFDWKRTHTWYNRSRKWKKERMRSGHNWQKELDYFKEFIEPLPQYTLHSTDN
tara:strand:- start:719 stop:1297 length:579 start_codon:yes stop_codon:yes gene_type:complete